MTRYAVTGATGWLGRAALEFLSARGDDILAFASRERDLRLTSGAALRVAPLPELTVTPHDVLLHFGYVTREHANAMGVDAYVAANTAISGAVVDAIGAQRPQAIAYASSGAVYSGAGRLAWDVRNDPYGALKHLDELALRQAAADAGATGIVARIFNVAGPWIVKPRGFALSDVALQVMDGGPVRLRADHPVERSYVDVEDLAALMVALAAARRDVVFDAAGAEVVEVGALAERIAAVLGRSEILIERDWDPAALPDRYVGDGATMHALAAEHGVKLRVLDEQIRRTVCALGGVPA